MLSRELVDRLIDAALAGGDFAEVFYENSRQCQIDSFYSHFESCALGIEAGVGIRILKGLQTTYAYTNDLRPEALLALAKNAAAQSGQGGGLRAPLAQLRHYGPGAAADELPDAPYAQKMEVVNRALGAGKAYNSEISQVKCRYLDEAKEVLVANSEGVFAQDLRQKTRLVVTAYAQNEKGLQSGYYGPGAMCDFSFYNTLDVKAVAEEAARMALVNLHAQKCAGGRMPVVVAGGFGGLLFHEACGHSLESGAVAKGLSEFTGRLGEQVASPLVTLVDDGALEGEWGSLHVDDEGTTARRNMLIENGVLRSFMVDRLGSRRMHLPLTGSARRQSYRFAPTARMTNTFIAPGQSKPEELIADTERGLYVKAISAGSVDPATGDFNFTACESYLIENGKLGPPVCGATLIGNGGAILKAVDGVADDLEIRQGYCYAASGQLFIGAGQPAVRVAEMTVGGVSG